MTWHPMESAPRDGTTVLLYGIPQHLPTMKQGPRRVMAYWDADEWREVCTAWTGPRVVAYKWAELPKEPVCDT